MSSELSPGAASGRAPSSMRQSSSGSFMSVNKIKISPVVVVVVVVAAYHFNGVAYVL